MTSSSDSPLEDPGALATLKTTFYYRRSTFFKFNRDQGTIVNWNAQRSFLATEDFIIALQKGIEHEVGESSGWLMYLIGRNWGMEDARHFKIWFERDYHLPLELTNIHLALETWWWPFVAQGWGQWRIDLSASQDGFIFVDLLDSVVAATIGYTGKPVCFIYAGLLAGFFSVALKRPVSSIEIQCNSMGDPYCRFLISSNKRVKAEEFWLANDATAQDIEHPFHHSQRTPPIPLH